MNTIVYASLIAPPASRALPPKRLPKWISGPVLLALGLTKVTAGALLVWAQVDHTHFANLARRIPLARTTVHVADAPRRAAPTVTLGRTETIITKYERRSAPLDGPKSGSPLTQTQRTETLLFDGAAAIASIRAETQMLEMCRRPGGPTGPGVAEVFFAPGGHVATVSLSEPYAGTPVGRCVARQFAKASVDPFDGAPAGMRANFSF